MKYLNCKICQQKTIPLFTAKVLNKYSVQYYRCPNCDFIQTEKSYWLNEAYQNAITDLDVGLVYRNLQLAKDIYKIIISTFDFNKTYLDYAGGYGLFVRIMRDSGLNYFYQDKYCENIFAKNFDVEDFKPKEKFEALTALEVFEHLENPIKEIKKMLSFSETIIFSTELIPSNHINSPSDWWYFVPETGQHIAFYSKKTLEHIAKSLSLSFYTKNNLHILTKKIVDQNPFDMENKKFNIVLSSLLDQDFIYAKEISTSHKRIVYKSLNNNRENKLNNNALSLISEFNILEEKFINTAMERDQIASDLQRIYISKGWRILQKIYSTKDMVFPQASIQKKCLKKILFLLKLIKTKTKRIHKQKRYFNKNSKKIVYVGHSYHAKTNSTRFLIDFLKKHFDVTEILDNSWQGKPFPDLSFVDNSYLGVIFFQNLPPKESFDSVKNDNLIFFPMYDAYGGLDFDFWLNYSKLKIINFSSTLHKKLSQWGFESMSIQYFPKSLPQSTTTNKPLKVFFWQRTNKIDINTVEKLLGKIKAQIHIHRAIDPYCTYIPPTTDQEKKYNITYSDWFKTREEAQQQIQQCDIYIAPREYEGIGLSFVEAMAMGKAVVAADKPTMNEYIVDHQTGYLFDPNSPQPIDFTDIKEVKERAYQSVTIGYQNWDKDKVKIMDFIYKE